MTTNPRKFDYSDIIERICDCGYQAYLVGGVARDILAGEDPSDMDIATDATPDVVELLFRDRRVKTVGKSFGVVRVDGCEVATFRHDRYSGLDDKACEVSYAETIEEDLGRRDLTINAMAFCNRSGDIIDPHNGRKDLKNRTIRFVGNPKDRICEDPNRIVRACRFLAKIDGQFSTETFEAIKDYTFYVRDHVAPERLKSEIMKAMNIQAASRFFYAMHNIGALQYLFPSMDRCYNHPHGSHHLEDVFDHLMLCGDSISPKFPLLKLAGYLHDVGKPPEYKLDQKTEKYHFGGHASTGSEMVRSEMSRLKFSNKEINVVTFLIGLHMKKVRNISRKSARRLLANLESRGIGYKNFLRLQIADRKANLAKQPYGFHDIKEMTMVIKRELSTPFSVNDLAVNGREVMEILNIPQGPKVGEVLNGLFDHVMDKGQEANDRQKLLAIIHGMK
ncbi:CCA tRNA nucleotidyltransferase [Thermodesulfobacteriota bacterium]